MKKVYLVGFMGSGKSAIGRRLSYILKMPYYDMDREIEKKMKLTVSQIFEIYGEEYFRDLETLFLQEFRDEYCIIATGGGVAMRAINRKIMRRTGLVFYLNGSFPNTWVRIANDKNRPIVVRSTKEEVEQLYFKRKPLYRASGHINVLTDGRSLRQITDYIIFQINRLKGVQ